MKEQLNFEHNRMKTSIIDFDGISIVHIPTYDISNTIYRKSVAKILRNLILRVVVTVS
jgi:hypothetical protein